METVIPIVHRRMHLADAGHDRGSARSEAVYVWRSSDHHSTPVPETCFREKRELVRQITRQKQRRFPSGFAIRCSRRI